MGDARGEMIDAAERLAAEGGLAAMSLRAVQEAAGQRNKSAAHYHFGSRDGLLAAIVAARSAPIDERRAVLLDELGDDPALVDLVRAFVQPFAEAATGEQSYWARFLRVAIADPATNDVITSSLSEATYHDVRTRLEGAIHHLDHDLRRRRLNQMVALVVWTLAVAETAGDDVDVGDLVVVATAVLTAPAT